MAIVIIIIIAIIYTGAFRIVGWAIKSLFSFFEEFFREVFRGRRYRRTLSKLVAFVAVVIIIAIVMALR